jgi:predicted ATPase
VSDLLRLRGELLLDGGGDRRAEAETALAEALRVAREQGARALELEAATSIARLWRDEGRRDDAYNLLAGVYAAFDEGLETHDLRAAAALLATLGPASGAVAGGLPPQTARGR